MRLKRNELKKLYIWPRDIQKNAEGLPTEIYGTPCACNGIVWPAGGAVQADPYGERTAYRTNILLDGKYGFQRRAGKLMYVTQDGAELTEGYGIGMDSTEPEYRIVAIRAYGHLQLEVEHIGGRTGRIM